MREACATRKAVEWGNGSGSEPATTHDPPAGGRLRVVVCTSSSQLHHPHLSRVCRISHACGVTLTCLWGLISHACGITLTCLWGHISHACGATSHMPVWPGDTTPTQCARHARWPRPLHAGGDAGTVRLSLPCCSLVCMYSLPPAAVSCSMPSAAVSCSLPSPSCCNRVISSSSLLAAHVPCVPVACSLSQCKLSDASAPINPLHPILPCLGPARHTWSKYSCTHTA